MTENKIVFTLTAVLDDAGRLTVKTEGICTNNIVGKVIEEICYQYDEAIVNIDKKLVLDDEDGEFYEDVADEADGSDNNVDIPVIIVCACAAKEDADDSVDVEGTSDTSDAGGTVADAADDDSDPEGTGVDVTSDNEVVDSGAIADATDYDDAGDGVDVDVTPDNSVADGQISNAEDNDGADK